MKLYRLRAFPKSEKGGNKAGVVLNADSLSEKEMKKIAKEIGYSETAFVMKSKNADFKVRFFTPISEVDLCGHATIATFNLMRNLGILQEKKYTQETKAGILNIDVKKDMVFMEQPSPIFSETIEKKDIASCFKNKDFIHDELPIQVVSTGMREIFIPVKNYEILNALIPDFEEIIEASVKYQVIGIHAFSLSEEVNAYGRNFAPIVGIEEESATGTSNGALGCYLSKYVANRREYTLRQGYSMDLPSEIITHLEFTKKGISKVWVGGSATEIIEK